MTQLDVTQLTAVLTWLASGGSAYAVLWIVANWLEKWSTWNALPVPVKFIVPLILAVVVGIGAFQLLTFSDVLTWIQPYWQMAVVIVLAYLGSQVGHLMTKTSRK